MILSLIFFTGMAALPLSLLAESKAESAKRQTQDSAAQPSLTTSEIFAEEDLAEEFSNAGEKLANPVKKEAAAKKDSGSEKSDHKASGKPAGGGSMETANGLLLDKFPPAVTISNWGTELRITVNPNKFMPEEDTLSIQLVKLETEAGEFLGLKAYGPNEPARTAEFMIDPAVLKIENVKVTVSAGSNGEWTKLIPLKIEEKIEETKESGAPEASGTQVPQPAEPAKKPAKKKWFW